MAGENTKIYRRHGGAEQVHASGSTHTYESGSTLDASGAAVTLPNISQSAPGFDRIVPVAVADSAGDTDVTIGFKCRIVDAWAVKTASNGGAGDTVTVKNGANSVTDAISLNVNDTLIARAGAINDANHEIAAGGTLRITAAKVTNCACIVYVRLMPVA